MGEFRSIGELLDEILPGILSKKDTEEEPEPIKKLPLEEPVNG